MGNFLWDIVTIGSQSLVIVLIVLECRHPLRYPTWSLAWLLMLLAQGGGLLLRIGNTINLHWRPLPEWLLDQGIPFVISVTLIYFLLTLRRIFPYKVRPWKRDDS